MDSFNVPKKVNRHILKAVCSLSNGNPKKRLSVDLILNRMKYQMRNLVPVPNIEMVIHESLKNLTNLGVIERVGPQRYALGQRYVRPAPPTNAPGREFFKATDPRKRSRSQLDPNLNRAHHSEDSLSGDEFDRTRKRLRTNTKQLKRTGSYTELPKARQHDRNSIIDNHLCIPGFSDVDNHTDIDPYEHNIGSPINFEEINALDNLANNEEFDHKRNSNDENKNSNISVTASTKSQSRLSQIKIIEFDHTYNTNDKVKNSDLSLTVATEIECDIDDNTAKQSTEILNFHITTG